jgi:hypothetical protein
MSGAPRHRDLGEIARAVDNANNLHVAAFDSIQREPAVNDQHACVRRDIRTFRAEFGKCQQVPAASLDPIKAAFGCRLAVGGDMNPDIDEVCTGLMGEAKPCHGYFDLLSLRASAFTAAMSSSPASPLASPAW